MLLLLWVPSSNKKVGCHGTPFLSIFCHSNTFYICSSHTNLSHHLSRFFFDFLCALSLLSFLPSVVLFPFPRIKCPKYCSFLSCIVLKSVCFALAISKTSKLVFLSRCHILNMRQKMHISKALTFSSICFSVIDSETYKKVEST